MVHSGSMEIVHEGWLTKSPPPKRLLKVRWRTRWFVLRSGDLPGQYLLEYYVDATRKKLKGTIDLDQCEQVDAGITFATQKEPSDNGFMFDIRTPNRIYYLQCQTEPEMNKWVDCLCQVCGLKAQADDANLGNPILPPSSTAHMPQSHHPGSLSASGATGSDIFGSNSHNSQAEANISPSSISSISGPYIPISECITGRKAGSNNNNNNNSSNNQSNSTSNNVVANSLSSWHPFQSSPNNSRRLSIPSEMAPPAPLGPSSLHPSTSSLATSASTASTLVADNNFGGNRSNHTGTLPHSSSGGAKPRSADHIRESYDQPRPLRGGSCTESQSQHHSGGRQQTRSTGAASEEGSSSVRSPLGTDSSSSVFIDDDWNTTTPHSLSGQGFFGVDSNGQATAADGGGIAVQSLRSHVKDPMLANKTGAGGLSTSDGGEAPPRPPKPAHLEVPQQNYMNIDTIVRASTSRKNSMADPATRKLSNAASVTSHDGNVASSSDAEPSPLSATSSLASTNTPSGVEHTDQLYEFPRSHVRETMNPGSVSATERSRRHCYNNAAPSSVTSDRVFSYDPTSLPSSETDPRISPALYSNLSSIHGTSSATASAGASVITNRSPAGPPSVNRGLKPKVSSDGSSLSGNEVSPCVGTGLQPVTGAPAVDRNLKPSSAKSVGAGVSPASGGEFVLSPGAASTTAEFVLEPAPRSRPKGGLVRAAPSPTPPSTNFHNQPLPPPAEEDMEPPQSAHSWRNSAMPEEQVFYPAHSLRSPPMEIQYLDLDLNSAAAAASAAGESYTSGRERGMFQQHGRKDQLGGGKKAGNGTAKSQEAEFGGAVGGAVKPATVSKALESSKVEYQTVDFIKTEALSKMRREIENNYKNNQT